MNWAAVSAAGLAVFLAPLHAENAGHADLVFAAWNVRNYRTSPSAARGNAAPTPAKSPESIDAVARTLAGIRPSVIGLCEIGSRSDLADLQRRLAKLGLDLPHSAWVEAADEDRHLALLSAYPVVSEQHETGATFTAGGLPQRVQRGFLDCTIAVRPDFQLRVLGAHLKSRRNSSDADPSEFRRHESLLLRQKIEKAAAENPRVLLYGDLNDTKSSPSVAGLTGRRGEPASMHIVPLADPEGETWTYYWAAEDEYTRVDYIMASRALRPLLQKVGSQIVRDRGWLQASDHRPLVVRIKIPGT